MHTNRCCIIRVNFYLYTYVHHASVQEFLVHPQVLWESWEQGHAVLAFKALSHKCHRSMYKFNSSQFTVKSWLFQVSQQHEPEEITKFYLNESKCSHWSWSVLYQNIEQISVIVLWFPTLLYIIYYARTEQKRDGWDRTHEEGSNRQGRPEKYFNSWAVCVMINCRYSIPMTGGCVEVKCVFIDFQRFYDKGTSKHYGRCNWQLALK